MSIIKALQKLDEIIVYYSTNGPDFINKPSYDSKLKRAANKIEKKNFKVIRKSRISYCGSKNKYTIRLDDTNTYISCSLSSKNFI